MGIVGDPGIVARQIIVLVAQPSMVTLALEGAVEVTTPVMMQVTYRVV